MKKKSVFSILAISVLLISMLLTSCGPKTLESYVEGDKDLKKQIDQISATTEGLTVEIKGNDVIYTYDLASLGVSGDLVKGQEMKKSLEDALAGQASTFEGIVTTLEKETKIDSIKLIVNYTYEKDTVVTKTFEN